MKKTVAIVLLLTFVTVFFCSSVFGATNTVGGRKSTSKLVSNVTVYLDLDQLGHTNGGNGDGMAYTPFFVTMRVWNNNTQAALVDSLKFRINVATSTQIVGIENLSPDLTVGYYNGTQFQVTPSNDYAYGSGVVVPPKESIYLVCMIYVQDITNNGVNAPSTISSAEIPDFTVGVSDAYPYGTPVDFSPILTYMSTYQTLMQGISEGTADINTALGNLNTALTYFSDRVYYALVDIEGQNQAIYDKLAAILTEMTWTGTYTSPTFGNNGYISSSTTGLAVNVRKFRSIPLTDFEIADHDSVVSDVLYKTPVCLTVNTSFTTSQKYAGTFYISGIIDGALVFDIPTVYSTWIDSINLNIRSGYLDVDIYSDQKIIPDGSTSSTIWFYVYSRTNAITLNQCNINITNSDYTSDVESQSDSLINQSNQAHSQEQAFFNQNSQAITNSGLGNYQFSANQQSGISVVTGLFNRLWSSVGSWNTVYVFSLTITVALTILRYTTNAIRRRSYSEDKGGKP